MKKILSLLSVAVLCGWLVGCGGTTDTAPPAGGGTPPAAEPMADEPAAEPTAEPAAEPTAEPAAEPKTE